MNIEIAEEPMTALAQYALVSIAFEGKSYDAVGGGPSQWEKSFDLRNWGLITAKLDGRVVGGAVIAFDTPGVDMLEGRRDLAVLWDIRVEPPLRGQGIGASIFGAVEQWAASRGCTQLKVETQNINVAACRFYERRGCRLAEARARAYPQFPDEIQMLFFKDLA